MSLLPTSDHVTLKKNYEKEKKINLPFHILNLSCQYLSIQKFIFTFASFPKDEKGNLFVLFIQYILTEFVFFMKHNSLTQLK